MSSLVSRRTSEGLVASGANRRPLVLHTVSIAPLTATPTAGLLTIYDSATETGTVVYSEWIFATTPGHTILLDCVCPNGIYVGFDAALANVSVTVTYS